MVARTKRKTTRRTVARRKPARVRGRVVKKNPSGGVAAAARRFKTWHEFEPQSAQKLARPIKVSGAVAVIGQPVEIVYRSDKYSGNPAHYVHRFKGKNFIMAANPEGTAVILFRRDGKPFAKREGLIG